jgi:hypothetical protein
VRTNRRILLAGLAVAGLYLAAAAVSGHLSPWARRPLLDGFSSAPPYRWVKPPEALKHSNQPPRPGAKSFPIKSGALQGSVVSTDDLQVTLILQDGAFRAPSGAGTLNVTVQPLDPAPLSDPPSGLLFDGNAYRFRGTFAPTGGLAPSTMATAGDLAMVYPADATFGVGGVKHVILASPDGRNWRQLTTQDLPASQQASAKLPSFGYVVVARTEGAGTPSTGSSRSFVPLLIAGIVVLLILVFTSPRVLRRFRRERPGDAAP